MPTKKSSNSALKSPILLQSYFKKLLSKQIDLDNTSNTNKITLNPKKLENSQCSKHRALVVLGTTIRFYRKRLNLSQEDLAWRIGVHRTYIGGVERGERNISILKILEIASSMRLKPEDLVSEVDKLNLKQ